MEPVYRRLMTAATKRGFSGFGGNCGQAAIAINTVVLGGRGSLIGAFNEFFCEKLNQHVGHIAVQVRVDGPYLDADGAFKDKDDIESWGMLDPNDNDYTTAVEEAGLHAHEDDYQNVACYLFDNATVMQNEVLYAYDHLDEMIQILSAALNDMSDRDQRMLRELRELAEPIALGDD
jgi:hypothetical protein